MLCFQPESVSGSLSCQVVSASAEGALQIPCLVRITHLHKECRTCTDPLQSSTLSPRATGAEAPGRRFVRTAFCFLNRCTEATSTHEACGEAGRGSGSIPPSRRQGKVHWNSISAFGRELCGTSWRRISGLVVEYIVAIDVTWVRFPADAVHWCSDMAQPNVTTGPHAQ